MRPSAIDPRILKAYGHPLRVQALDLLEARVASPSEIADALGERVGSVAYHVRQLEGAGLVRLVERPQRGGAREACYTACFGPTISDREWSRLPILDRRAVIAGALRRLGPEFGAAISRGGFDRDGSHVNLVRARVDGRAWRSARRTLMAALARVEEIALEAKLRLSRADAEDVERAVVVMMLFKEPVGAASNGAAVSPERPIDLADPRVLSASAHPLRTEIFKALCEREASPSDIARQLGAPTSNVSYHVRQLLGLSLVELTYSREKRGALEHYYKAAVRPTILDEGWDGSFRDETTSGTARHIVATAREGGFDADDIHCTRTPLPIDRDAWEAIADRLGAVRRRLDRLSEESARRVRARPTVCLEAVGAVTMLFERRTVGPAAASPASGSP